MFEKEHPSRKYGQNISKSAATSLDFVKTLTGLTREEAINRALLVHAELEARGEAALIAGKPNKTYLDNNPTVRLHLEEIETEKYPDYHEYVIYGLTDQTAQALPDFPAKIDIEGAITTYAGIVGHVFMGNQVSTEQFLTRTEVAGAAMYQTLVIEPYLPKMKTAKEQKYRGRTNKK